MQQYIARRRPGHDPVLLGLSWLAAVIGIWNGIGYSPKCAVSEANALP
jgi:hypothetical protein